MRLCYREIATRDNQRPHAAEPTVLIDHRPESRSFHIFYEATGVLSVFEPRAIAKSFGLDDATRSCPGSKTMVPERLHRHP